VGFRAARRAAYEVFDVRLARGQGAITAVLDHTLAVLATPDGAACGFFGTASAELLRQLAEYEGGMTHVRCRARGDDRCEWRAGPSAERRP
jgi:predicted hydrocarbon binding protein